MLDCLLVLEGLPSMTGGCTGCKSEAEASGGRLAIE